MRVYLGIDTSAYTTSICLLSEDGEIVSEVRSILEVPSGKRGLRQSEAVFQHIKNFPVLTNRIREAVAPGARICAVSASCQPRPQHGSYMPVFVPGASFGAAAADLLNAPFFSLTHQENHIWSGIKTSGGPTTERFLVIHLSGGTTELMEVQRRSDYRLLTRLLGETSDLHAGQFVDRIGVALGLQFPAGAELDRLAQQAQSYPIVPSSHKSGRVSFSGPLTSLLNQIEQVKPTEAARSCFEVISRTLTKWIEWASGQTDCRDLLIVGGVAANSIIRNRLAEKLRGWRLFFADPRYSTDNALGAAYYAGLADGQFELGE